MRVEQLATGLWYWSVGDRGSVYYEPGREPRDAIVLIDPSIPEEGSDEAARFWRALDRDVHRVGSPIAVLATARRHLRSAERIRLRYRDGGATVHVPAGEIEPGTDRAPCGFGRDRPPPAGVRAVEPAGRDGAEVAFWIDEHRTLVVGDALVGLGEGKLRLAAGLDRRALRPWIDLRPERVLTTHGPPLLSEGLRTLRELADGGDRDAS